MCKELVIGIKRGVSKNNRAFTILYTCSDFSDYDREHGAFGQQTNETYVNDSIKCDIGDSVQYVYKKGFQGKAVLDNVVVESGSDING